MSRSADSVPWRSLAAFVLLPNFFYGATMGVAIPMTPIFATDLGASVALAALVASMLLVGQLAASLPAGWAIHRIRERPSVLVASAISTLGGACCLLAPSPLVLAVGALLIGIGAAVFGIARHAFVTLIAPPRARGRALAVVAGSNRLGVLVGPFLGAAAIGVGGSVRAAYVVVISASLSLALSVTLFGQPEDRPTARRPAHGGSTGPQSLGVLRTTRLRGHVLLRVGVAAALLSAMRSSRQIVVPLWAVTLGIKEVDIALIVGIAAAVDLGLFYIGGQVMDHLGRLWAGVPTMVVFGLGQACLAFVDEYSPQVGWFVAITLVLAVGNGISSGLVATMGSDLADPINPAAFLSSWKLVVETGAATAPLAISAITAVASLRAATVAMGGLGLVGAAMLWRHVPRHLPDTARRWRRTT